MKRNCIFIRFLLIFTILFSNKPGYTQDNSITHIRCSYLKCFDKNNPNKLCTPRDNPIQSFEFIFSKKQVKSGEETSSIISTNGSSIVFGRSYDSNFYKMSFPRGKILYYKNKERYAFDKSTFSITKQIDRTIMTRVGDFDSPYFSGDNNPNFRLVYQGKCEIANPNTF